MASCSRFVRVLHNFRNSLVLLLDLRSHKGAGLRTSSTCRICNVFACDLRALHEMPAGSRDSDEGRGKCVLLNSIRPPKLWRKLLSMGLVVSQSSNRSSINDRSVILLLLSSSMSIQVSRDVSSASSSRHVRSMPATSCLHTIGEVKSIQVQPFELEFGGIGVVRQICMEQCIDNIARRHWIFPTIFL